MGWRPPRLRVRTLLLLVALAAVVLWGVIILVSPTRWLERRLHPGAPAYARRDAAGTLGASWVVPPWEVNRAVSALIGALDDPNAMVRQQAVMGLGERGSAAVRALPSLEARLGDESGGVRYTTAAVLALLAPMADDRATRLRVEGVLVEAMADPDPLVRLRAAQSLLDLGREDEAAAGLAEALTGPNEQVRNWATFDLQRRGTKLPGVVSAVVELIKEGRPGIAGTALPALVEFASPSELRSALRLASESPDAETREAALAHLDRIAIEAAGGPPEAQ